ncbi:HDOD domain-containing protein [Aquabacterium sp.]|uniref:HDOD domain-containing protein n=1 Tax=Aquabacterium sp. TaxID=1872578 RepID=UPI0035AEDFAD
MNAASATPYNPNDASAIQRELDQLRKQGPLQHIVIPPCPELLTRLQAAMASAEPDLNEVARIAASDVAMSATLLRCANSPMYAAGQPAQTIGQAMNRLGLEQTAAVLTGFLAQRAIRVTSPHLKRYWERATKRALAMEFIAGKLPGASPDVAHTYGLFCHVGMPVMLQSVKDYAGTVVEANARIDRSYTATENANHRTDHAVVGALVARVWNLAPSVMAAIRLHHDFDMLGERGTQAEVQTLVAEHFVRNHEGLESDVDWNTHAAAALRWLDVSGDELSIWEDELQATLDAA